MIKINIKINIIIIFFSLTLLGVLFISFHNKNTIDNENVAIKFDFIEYDLNYFDGESIIIPKNQTESQSLSIIVKNKNDELIIFDGGRIEDAKLLNDIIMSNGGNVKAWFLTHIHDDHIGAIYEIMTKYQNINIENLYYNFADFDFYEHHIGKDAGILILFNEALNNYKQHKINNNEIQINVYNNIKKDKIFSFSNISVHVLNNIYQLDSDPINNTSIVYKVSINGKTMLILGDLGYYGGEKLLNETNSANLLCDILVLSHHGQNGVAPEFYLNTNAKIVIWPTTKKIYENVDKKYYTDDTKIIINKLNPKLQIKSYEETAIIR